MAKLDLFLIDDLDVHNKIVDFVEEKINDKLYQGDERKIYLEALTAWTVVFLEKLNDYFNQRFAQYARGIILDAHGENESCERLDKTKSHTIERFHISSPRSFNVVIPAGTRVTADNEKYFSTEEIAVIMSGEAYVDVKVNALEGGVGYNGFEVGQVNKLVDRIEYISSVENLTETVGGDDGEPYPEEDGGIGDEHYYERIRLAKSTKSTAGAEGAYEYYAKSADASISDVQVTSPEKGKIKLIISCSDASAPSDEIISKVLEKCSAKEVRPLGDLVSVVGVTQKSYDIELCYYTTEAEESETVESVEGPGGAIDRYNEWQSSEIGRDINPDRLRAEILKSDTKPVGAEYVEIVEPTYEQLTGEQIAKWSGNMTVTHIAGKPSSNEEE